MTPSRIIGLTGQLGSGKGSVARYLAETYGAAIFKFSTYLSRVLDVMALEQSRDNLIRVSEALRGTFGEDALAHAIARDMTIVHAPMAVVDGLRRPEDLTFLKELPTFLLVAVNATPEIRFSRIRARGEKTDEDNLSWEQFQAHEQRSPELTIPQTMKLAAHTITNNGTEQELRDQIDALMEKIGIKK
jgi:dephospho-CoA kinase